MKVIIGDKELDMDADQTFNSHEVPIAIILNEHDKKNLLMQLTKHPKMSYYITIPENVKKLGPLVDDWIDKI
jgi:hypothetical protein